MAKKAYELTANVSTENPQAIRPVLEGLIGNGSVTPSSWQWYLNGLPISGATNASDVNRPNHNVSFRS
jgi:hypothetical protein